MSLLTIPIYVQFILPSYVHKTQTKTIWKRKIYIWQVHVPTVLGICSFLKRDFNYGRWFCWCKEITITVFL